jgi:predicted tellurium resistance membrane protein TerC
MNRDILAYVAMSVLGVVAVVLMVVGVAKHNFDISLMGMFIASYAVIIGTSTSVLRALRKEIKDQIKNLQR